MFHLVCSLLTKSIIQYIFHPQDYILDNCNLAEVNELSKQYNMNERECQKYCDESYHGLCKIFIFDRVAELCKLSKDNIDHFASNCNKIAGSTTPSCKLSETCKVRKFVITIFYVLIETPLVNIL